MMWLLIFIIIAGYLVADHKKERKDFVAKAIDGYGE